MRFIAYAQKVAIATLAIGFGVISAGADGLSPTTLAASLGRAKMVAYDAKDKKYYSVEYAKSHNMHDRGGDLLVIMDRAKLPKGAKLSHAMHGVEP